VVKVRRARGEAPEHEGGLLLGKMTSKPVSSSTEQGECKND